MTNTKQNSIISTSGDQTDWPLKGEADLEKWDRQSGHQYVPMDVYVDPKTIKEHFQSSSISDRWTRIHRASS